MSFQLRMKTVCLGLSLSFCAHAAPQIHKLSFSFTDQPCSMRLLAIGRAQGIAREFNVASASETREFRLTAYENPERVGTWIGSATQLLIPYLGQGAFTPNNRIGHLVRSDWPFHRLQFEQLADNLQMAQVTLSYGSDHEDAVVAEVDFPIQRDGELRVWVQLKNCTPEQWSAGARCTWEFTEASNRAIRRFLIPTATSPGMVATQLQAFFRAYPETLGTGTFELSSNEMPGRLEGSLHGFQFFAPYVEGTLNMSGELVPVPPK